MCAEPVHAVIGDIALCRGHFEKVFHWHNEQVGLEARLEADRLELERANWQREMSSWQAQGRQIVYYLLREDCLIKIGTTANLPMRMASLQAQHGPLMLLLTHCGDRAREHQMHVRFAPIRVEGEWFRPDPALLAFILKTRRKRANASTRHPQTIPVREVQKLASAVDELAAEGREPIYKEVS